MKKSIMGLLVIGLMIGFVAPVMAESGTAGEALPVLRFGVGARAFALGGAYGAIAEDATAVYWNPAGLAYTSVVNLNVMHSELFQGTTYDYLGWAMPIGKGTIGINLLRLSTPGIILVDDGVVTGVEDASTDAFYIGYGREIQGWAVGITGKFSRQDLPTVTGEAWGLDIGVQKKVNDRFRVGLALQDIIGSKVKWDNGHREEVPTNYRLGLAYTRDRYLVIIEHETTGDFSQSHFGLEYTAAEFLKIRGGIRGNDFTAGIGISKDAWEIDYAYCGGDLGNTHRLSLGWNI